MAISRGRVEKLFEQITTINMTGSLATISDSTFGSGITNTHQFSGSIYSSGSTTWGAWDGHNHIFTGSIYQTGSGDTNYFRDSNVFGSASTNLHQFTGSVDISGTLRANEYRVNIIDTKHGSTIFGNDTSDLHQMTGSLQIYDDAEQQRWSYDATAVNYASLTVAANGATTLATVDSDGNAGELLLKPQGTVRIDTEGQTAGTAGLILSSSNAYPVMQLQQGATDQVSSIAFATGSGDSVLGSDNHKTTWAIGYGGPDYPAASLPGLHNSFNINQQRVRDSDVVQATAVQTALGLGAIGLNHFSINNSGSIFMGKSDYGIGASTALGNTSDNVVYIDGDVQRTASLYIRGPHGADQANNIGCLDLSASAIQPAANRASYFIRCNSVVDLLAGPRFWVSASGETTIEANGPGTTGTPYSASLFVYASGALGGTGGGSDLDTAAIFRAGTDGAASAGKCKYLRFQHGAGGDGGGIQNGSTAANPEFFNGSDLRVKRDVQPTKIKGLETINRLDLIEFKWDPKFLKKQTLNKIGFSAQNCEQVYPDMVNEVPHKDFDFDIKNVAKGELIPVLVKAIQELSAEVEELKRKLDSG